MFLTSCCLPVQCLAWQISSLRACAALPVGVFVRGREMPWNIPGLGCPSATAWAEQSFHFNLSLRFSSKYKNGLLTTSTIFVGNLKKWIPFFVSSSIPVQSSEKYLVEKNCTVCTLKHIQTCTDQALRREILSTVMWMCLPFLFLWG